MIDYVTVAALALLGGLVLAAVVLAFCPFAESDDGEV